MNNVNQIESIANSLVTTRNGLAIVNQKEKIINKMILERIEYMIRGLDYVSTK